VVERDGGEGREKQKTSFFFFFFALMELRCNRVCM